jgi:uncharacterized membrane protein YphA (DoxX/SURF4 family)
MWDIYTRKILTYLIALTWLVNGLLCKVLNLVPRHEQIVARILGDQYSRTLTLAIGFSEIGMAVWVLSGVRSRYNAILQIAIVAAMNLLEFFLVPDLLLWGRLNSLFAFFFILIIYYAEFKLNPNQT